MLEAPKIIELYLAGVSSGEIAKKYGVTPNGILALLKKHNIKRRKSGDSLKRVDDNKILSLYESGLTPSEIARKTNFSVTTITSALKRVTNYAFNPIAYEVKWPTNKQFELYYIGLLLADGCLSIRRKRGLKKDGLAAKGRQLKLTLHKNDQNVLDAIKKVVSKDRPLSKNGNCINFDIPVSKKEVTYLEKYGITERKSLTLKPTNTLDKLNKRDFFQLLTGFIEGDGCIALKNIKAPNSKRYQHIQVGITSTNEFLGWVRAKLIKFCDFDSLGKINSVKNSRAYDFRITGSKAICVIKECLKSEFFYMDRKWQKINSVFHKP